MDFEIRKDRSKPRRRKKLARERAAYFQLMQQGYSSREACRIVGVDVRTGKKWRNGHHSPGHGRKPIPPTCPEGPASSGLGRYLAEDERIHIADRRREKAGIRTIARELGRCPSTISRELRRNQHPNSKQYRPHAAQARADARCPRPKPGKIAQNPALREFIQRYLSLRWSPEQICQTLRSRFPTSPEMHVAHETIYQALYVQGRGELRRELTRALRTGRAMRKPRRQAQRRDALTDAVVDLPEHLRRSLTWDQGTEMGRHHDFSVATGVPVYFCDQASPWQRGSNESTKGRFACETP